MRARVGAAPGLACANRGLHAGELRLRHAEALGGAHQDPAGRRRDAVAREGRAQLQLDERGQQVEAQAASFAQLLDAQIRIVGRRFPRSEAFDGGGDLVWPEAQVLHEPPRRIDLRFRDAPVGFGDVPHDLEGRSEEHVRDRGGGRAGKGVAEPDALIEQEADEGAHDRAGDGACEQEADHRPENRSFPSHSLTYAPRNATIADFPPQW